VDWAECLGCFNQIFYWQFSFYQAVLQFGRQEGLREQINLRLHLFTLRYGELSIAKQEQVRSLPIDILESLGKTLLDFREIEDLEVWL